MPRIPRSAPRAALPLPVLLAGATMLCVALLLLADQPSTWSRVAGDLLLGAVFGGALTALAATRRPRTTRPPLRLVASGGRRVPDTRRR